MNANPQGWLDDLPKESEKFLEALFEKAPMSYFKDWIIVKMIDAELPVIEATEAWLKSYKGFNSFVQDVARKTVKGNKQLTPRQARALINVACKERKEGNSVSIGASPAPSPAAKPAPALEKVTLLVCYKCNQPFHTWSDLNAHKESAHPREYKCSCGHVTTDVEVARSHRKEHYKPLFDGVPQTGIDLNLIPTGRYAVPDLAPGSTDYIFLMVTRIKRDHTRSKKFRYGWKSYGSERVATGTLEVRQWRGDTKELIGEQRPGETYRGTHTEEFQMILQDPVASTKLFGRLIEACGRCGRTLTDPDSRRDGIGPECIKHYDDGATKIHSTETVEELAAKLVSGRKPVLF